MPKRKRSEELNLPQKLEKHEDEIFKALKVAKGFERQRLSKRLHDAGLTPGKKERLDREITVLKVGAHNTRRKLALIFLSLHRIFSPVHSQLLSFAIPGLY